MDNNYRNDHESNMPLQNGAGMSVQPQIPSFIPNLLSPERIYKRDIKSTLMKIILILIAYLIIQTIVMAVLQSVIMFSSGFMDDIMNIAQNGSADIDMNSIMAGTQESVTAMTQKYIGVLTLLSAVVGLPIFLIIRGRKLFSNNITERRASLSVSSFIKFFIIAMGAQIVFTIGTNLLNTALEGTGQSSTDMLEQTMQMLNTPAGLIYICLIGPIVEELIFRGAIMKSLEGFGLNFAIVISSLIFGLYHIFTVQAIFAFFMGLILGYIASRYSLKWSMLTHIFINSAATGLGYLDAITLGGSADSPSAGVLTLATVVMLAFFVVGLILLIKERWRFAEQKNVGAPTEIPGLENSPKAIAPPLWKTAFTSIPLLLYIAITAFAGIAIIIWGFDLTSLGT